MFDKLQDGLENKMECLKPDIYSKWISEKLLLRYWKRLPKLFFDTILFSKKCGQNFLIYCVEMNKIELSHHQLMSKMVRQKRYWLDLKHSICDKKEYAKN